MKKSNRILLIILSCLISGAYLVPIWQIRLEAPQFPRGLFLQIETNDIHGTDEFMIDNINILNHYIGMKKIIPEDFPELKIIPWVICFLIVFGIFSGAIGNNKLLTVWLVIFIAFGFLGMYDFYSWEFSYGHDLNPRAPIKVPGMVYQPPLLGQKDLLNFRAFSYPYYGAIFLFVPALAGLIINIMEYVRARRIKGTRTHRKEEGTLEQTEDIRHA